MKQILVIAKNMRLARYEAQYIAYKMAEPSAWFLRSSEFRHVNHTVGIFCADPQVAVQQSVGLDLEEIVIVGDYLRWNFRYPGDFARLAQFIDSAVARGAKRRWA